MKMYWITGILGFILGISPYLFNYSDNMTALWSSIVLGSAVLLVSVIEGFSKIEHEWEYVAASLFGLIAIIVPFALSFADNGSALWSLIIEGGLILVLGAAKLINDNQSHKVNIS